MSLEFLENVPLDQIIALSCQALCLVAAVLFYHHLHIKSSSINTRHAVSLSIGVTVVLLCYGLSAIHLFTMCATSYLLMHFLPEFHRGWVVMVMCVCHVLAVHLHSYLYHYMVFRVDVSNSLMVLAIKVSCTAFSLDDASKPNTQLTSQQLKHKLKGVPSFFEYFSFCFCFVGILFGPAYHLNDYLSFINGDQYRTKWPWAKALKLLLTSLLCLLSHYLLSEKFTTAYNLSDKVLELPMLLRHLVLWFTMLVARCKYYFCWLSSEAIGHFCGMGYDPDEAGEKECGASIFTVNPMRIEFATNLKMFSDNWNVFTARWLHFCVYERVKKFKVLVVFMLSATWHGFYPGYFMMFMPLAVAILLGRKLRAILRPKFQTTSTSQLVYDVVTWLSTVLLISFNSCAFELREWHLIYSLQKSFYFWPHVVVVLGTILILPMKSSTNHQRDKTSHNGDLTQRHSTNGVHKSHAD